ncbi:hypothetical protein BT67DRAFT_445369 [Trichocladium antarcticum]|uniref:Uncharacterized protein n=1 Tax=Trichocladium antarcticum TaxID=1450529 RepID=A0AAN6ZA63_9PEZI|nr:hypothetical protein BT67DRAFT_445369 [Trichocladium antarcticum]
MIRAYLDYYLWYPQAGSGYKPTSRLACALTTKYRPIREFAFLVSSHSSGLVPSPVSHCGRHAARRPYDGLKGASPVPVDSAARRRSPGPIVKRIEPLPTTL